MAPPPKRIPKTQAADVLNNAAPMAAAIMPHPNPIITHIVAPIYGTINRPEPTTPTPKNHHQDLSAIPMPAAMIHISVNIHPGAPSELPFVTITVCVCSTLCWLLTLTTIGFPMSPTGLFDEEVVRLELDNSEFSNHSPQNLHFFAFKAIASPQYGQCF